MTALTAADGDVEGHAFTAEALRLRLNLAPMSPTQVGVVVLTVLLSALDGYDVLSTSFVAPVLGRAWHIDKSALGAVLSAGLAGMALGSLGLAPLADLFGRRPAVLAGLALMALGSLLSAFCHGPGELSAARVVTGLGIGLVIALIASLASEFANDRHRPLCVAAMAVGYPAGGVAGGLASAALLGRAGWPAVFGVGALAAVVLMALLAAFLPESPVFLAHRRAPDALSRLNHVLLRLKQAPLTVLTHGPAARRASYGSLFAPGLVGITLLLTLVNLLVATASYYVLSWLPQLVAAAGFGASKASLVSATASLVGIVSGLVLGAAAAVFGARRLAALAMVGLGVAIAAFGFAPPQLIALLAAAATCGFFLFGCVGVFYATMAASFPPLARVTGVGFVMGVGRVSSAVGPYLAGRLFDAGLGRGRVSLIFAVCAAIAGALLLTVYPRRSAGAQLGAEDAARS